MSRDQAPRRRLFFALWPDATVRQAMVELARGLPRKRGRVVPPPNLHITLAFAGAVDTLAHRCLVARAVRIDARAFSLRLARIGCFSRSRILWLGADTTPAALTTLVQHLKSALEHCGLKPDFRPYRPHVTLARDAAPQSRQTEIAPLHWRVDFFCLVASRTEVNGARYEILQRFGLCA